MNWKSIVLFACLAGCGGGSSRYMVKANERGSIVAPAGQVMVIFIRPSSYARGNAATVLDGNGTYVGQVPAKGYVRHITTPGTHQYSVWAENTAPMKAEFAAGKTYYVDVSMRMGGWSARAHLLPVKRSNSNWDDAPGWTQKCQEWVVTDEVRAKWRKKREKGVAKQLERAQTMWAKYDAEEREKRTMGPEDGR